MASHNVRKGDRFDNFGEVWVVTSVRGNRIVMAKEVRDAFGKVTLVGDREWHPRTMSHMRKLEQRDPRRRSSSRRASAARDRGDLYDSNDDLDYEYEYAPRSEHVSLALRRARRVWPEGMLDPFDPPVQVVEARGQFFVLVPTRSGPHIDSAHPTLRGAIRKARSLTRLERSHRGVAWRRRDPAAQYPGPRRKRTRAWAVVTNSGPERGFGTFFQNREDAIRFARRRRARGEDVRIDRVMPYRRWQKIGY